MMIRMMGMAFTLKAKELRKFFDFLDLNFMFQLQIRYNGLLLGTVAHGTANIWSTASLSTRLLRTINEICVNDSCKKIVKILYSIHGD